MFIKKPKTQSSREELVSGRYELVEPSGVYPLDTSTQAYPDFQPWRHSTKEDLVAVGHLQRGFFEAPHVGNELLSARNIMHQLLRSKNSLDELSTHFLHAIEVRAQNNRVGQGTHKPPPRVTLTDQKREAWLKDLANVEVPLRRLARTIPHGVRNRTLIEQCVAKKIPISRAVWFVRCVSTNELRGLKRKGGANIEFSWVQDWTAQVVESMEKLSHDYLKFEAFEQAKESWKLNVNYMLRFASNLYIENLVDKEGFKSWILTFFKSCKIYELPLALTIVKMFWTEICKTDFVVKELTETLILKYEKVSLCRNLLESKEITISDDELGDQVKAKLLSEIRSLVLSSFSQSIDNFILPNNWDQLGPLVRDLLDLNDTSVKKKFDIINYRNESLMINYSLDRNHIVRDLVSVLDSVNGTIDYKLITSLIAKGDWRLNVGLLIRWSVTKYRYQTYRVYLCSELCKRLKACLPVRELEQEILTIVFDIPQQTSEIVLSDLFVLLNELSQVKLFKSPIYLRRLISSGLIYQNDNKNEKLIHAAILRNLKSHRGSKASLVLKNLEDEVNNEQAMKTAMGIITSDVEYTHEDIMLLESLEVGPKLQLSETFLSRTLSRENLFPLLTYGELQKILKTLLHLGDDRGFCKVVAKALESQSLEGEEFLLVSECILTYFQLITITSDVDTIISSMLQNSQRLTLTVSMRKYWLYMLKNFNSKYSDDLELALKTKELEYDLPTIMLSLSDSDLRVTYEELLHENNFHNNFQVLIRSLFNNTDDNKRKSLVILLKILKYLNTAEFNRVLFVHIKKNYSGSTEFFKYEPLLDLILAELITIQVTVETFLGFNSQMHFAFILDLLFKDPSHSEPYDAFKQVLLRDQFKRDNHALMFKLVKKSLSDTEKPRMDSIQSDSAEIINTLMSDTTSATYKPEQLAVFLQLLTLDQKMIVNGIEFEEDSLKQRIISWLDDTLTGGERMDVDAPGKLVKYVKRLNRFNLPMIQLLFKLVLRSDVPESDLICILKSVITEGQKIVGSVFELLDTGLKIRLIHFLESMFLSSSTFPSVTIDDKVLDLVPLTDTLITLSSGTQNVNLPDDLVFSMDVSLETLIKVISQAERDTEELYAAVSLFLKIIIIHKTFLINIFVERNAIKENFLNNLVTLLTTKLVSQNLQLKNLLYDLILSIKSSINELNSSQLNNVKLPLSILNLPSISSVVDKVETISRNRQNLHDFNVVGNLYLYHKTTQSFHEFKIKPFDMVEESNPVENLNDTAIGLQLFEASMERKNPR